MANFVDALRQVPAYPLEQTVRFCVKAIQNECGRLRYEGHAAGVICRDCDDLCSLSALSKEVSAEEKERQCRKSLNKVTMKVTRSHYVDDRGDRWNLYYGLYIPEQHIDAVMARLHEEVRAMGFTRYTLKPIRMRQVTRTFEPGSFIKPLRVTDAAPINPRYLIYAELYW